ncbi:MAG: hypothetical protein U0401_14870 [Anaerolineae bacterium]
MSEENQRSTFNLQPSPPPEQTFTPGDTFAVRKIVPPATKRQPQPGRGRRSQTMATNPGVDIIFAPPFPAAVCGMW